MFEVRSRPLRSGASSRRPSGCSIRLQAYLSYLRSRPLVRIDVRRAKTLAVVNLDIFDSSAIHSFRVAVSTSVLRNHFMGGPEHAQACKHTECISAMSFGLRGTRYPTFECLACFHGLVCSIWNLSRHSYNEIGTPVAHLEMK